MALQRRVWRAAVLFLLANVLYSSPYTPREREAPALFLKRASDKYEQIMNSPEMASGDIARISRIPEFQNLSAKDKRYLGRALAAGEVIKNLSYRIDGSRLVLDDSRLGIAVPTTIDFRELSDANSDVIYINDKKYEIAFLRHGFEADSSQISDQLDDLEQFFATQGLQSFLNLNDEHSRWAYWSLRALIFPFAILTGCPRGSGAGVNGISAGGASQSALGSATNEAAAVPEKGGAPGAAPHGGNEVPGAKGPAKPAGKAGGPGGAKPSAPKVSPDEKTEGDYFQRPKGELLDFIQHTAEREFGYMKNAGNRANGIVQNPGSKDTHEDFLSVGMGHYIWYPETTKERPFEESFPEFVDYMLKYCDLKDIPASIKLVDGAKLGPPPMKDGKLDPAVATELSKFLLTEDARFCQARFQNDRARDTLYQIGVSEIKNKVPPNEKLDKLVLALLDSKRGRFALFDYVNFKGGGLLGDDMESYIDPKTNKPTHWGLKQVLLVAAEDKSNDKAVDKFARAAKAVLEPRYTTMGLKKLPKFAEDRINEYEDIKFTGKVD